MIYLSYRGEKLKIYEYKDAKRLIIYLANKYAGDTTPVSKGGRGRNTINYYNFPCSFDIETTTIKPGQLDYIGGPDDPPIAFPYLFQFNIYNHVIFCRHYCHALKVFEWIAKYFKTGGNRRIIFFDHNLGYEAKFFEGQWQIADGFALDEHHPVTLIMESGLMFRDSYKMTNMSLEAFTKDWSRKYFKEKDLMDYSELRTPYTSLDNNTMLYSALDVLSLSDGIIPYLEARGEKIWTRCPTSTSFIRSNLKKEIGIGAKKRTQEQRKYWQIIKKQKVNADQFKLLLRLARGGNTHANRKYTGALLSDICHYDIVSSYPAQMVCYPEYPLGAWAPLDAGSDPEIIDLFEQNGYCTMSDIALINPRIKPGVTVPYISISKMQIIEGSGMRASDNGRYMGGLKSIAVSIFGVEWPIIKAQYDFDDAIILEGYFCKKGYLPDVIRRFILKLYGGKTELKGIPDKILEYAIAKADVNGVFGMAYTSPIRSSFNIGSGGQITEKPPGDLAEMLDKYQRSISYFLPYAWGAMVAALGRVYLQKMIDAAGIYFVYCDTDSVFARHPEIVGPKIKELERELTEKQRACGLELVYYDIKGRPHELGGIDEEPRCEYFKTFGSKKYITVEGGELKCTIAGVPKKAGAKIIGKPENFNLGLLFKGSETGKNCLWYNNTKMILHDKGRPIEVNNNVAMLPVDYLLGLGADYMECLSIEGNFHWRFKEADKNTINEEDL